MAATDITYRGFTYTAVVPLGMVRFHGPMEEFDSETTLVADHRKYECFAARGAFGQVVLVLDREKNRYIEAPVSAVATSEIRAPKKAG